MMKIVYEEPGPDGPYWESLVDQLEAHHII